MSEKEKGWEEGFDALSKDNFGSFGKTNWDDVKAFIKREIVGGMKENKCEAAGLEHSWEDTTPNIVYATNPPQYPPKTEKCRNCDLEKTYREKTEKWVEYSDGKDRTQEWEDGGINLVGDDVASGVFRITDKML